MAQDCLLAEHFSSNGYQWAVCIYIHLNFRSLAKTGEPSNDLYSPTAQAHIYSSPTLLPLTKKQRRLVAKNPGTILAVAKGARMAVDECQYQFKERRWNCPVEENGHGGSIFGKILEKGKIRSFVFSCFTPTPA